MNIFQAIGNTIDYQCRAGQSGVSKTPMMGFREHGKFVEGRSMILKGMDRESFGEAIERNFEPGSTIITDEYGSYIGLEDKYNQVSVNHSVGEYVRDETHIFGLFVTTPK